MISKTKVAFWALLSAIVITAFALASHYHGKYTEERSRANAAESLAKTRQAQINGLVAAQKGVAEIDERYTKQLKAKDDEIASLRDRVDSGAVRLRVKASCPDRLPGTTSSPGMANAGAAELSPDARQDYYTLRRQLETATAQIGGLQDYIRTQCLK
ncbi:lysis protein [Jejubacter calystegiae]|uniref:lysis protein n=1 Tax=Jejubacter calystegiae TaxID=2579935 RepID=UPI001F4F6992|nr:lysis protein [Jejubacter calystegiae]